MRILHVKRHFPVTPILRLTLRLVHERQVRPNPRRPTLGGIARLALFLSACRVPLLYRGDRATVGLGQRALHLFGSHAAQAKEHVGVRGELGLLGVELAEF